MLQKAKVEGCADSVDLIEDDGAAVIALFEGFENNVGIVTAVFGRCSEACLVAWRRDRKRCGWLERSCLKLWALWSFVDGDSLGSSREDEGE